MDSDWDYQTVTHLSGEEDTIQKRDAGSANGLAEPQNGYLSGSPLTGPNRDSYKTGQLRDQLTILTLKKTQSKRPCQNAGNWEIGFWSSILLSRLVWS
jgi:hypothetical protein